MNTNTQPKIDRSDYLEPLGLVAGSGNFPIQFVNNAIRLGHKVTVVAHRGETDPDIENYGAKVIWIRFGELGKLIKSFKRAGVKRIAFAGGISRPALFKGNMWIDFRAVSLLARTKSVKDDIILRALAKELEGEGLPVFSATEFIPESLVKVGTLTKRPLSSLELDNAKIGWQAAKLIGQADIGQTVVVSEGMVVAVEAIEGTDETIKRAGLLIQGKGGVVIKVAKPQQDNRLDLPTIGVTTIINIANSGLTALVVEANKTIILNPLEVVKKADELKIAVSVFNKEGP